MMDFERLVSDVKKNRLNWSEHWQEIADRCLTEQADFNTKRSKGDKRDQRVFDGTAPMAVNRSASAIIGLITPTGQKWHTLSTDDPKLNDDKEVKEYFDEVTRILFKFRYAPKSGFSTANYEAIRSMMAFGTGNMTVNEDPTGRGIRYQSLFLGNIYLGVDAYARVDKVVREFEWTKQQAEQVFESLPEKLEREKDPYAKFKFYHIVYTNDTHNPFSINPKDRKYQYAYVCQDDFNCILEEGGYYEFPFSVCRDVTSPIEIYGRSPAMHVLPEIKGLNEMRKTVIRAAHKVVSPPLLAPSQGMMGVGTLGSGGMRISVQPDAITYGGVNAQGQQLVHPLQTNARPDIGQQMINDSRQAINDAFLLNLFQVLVETPTMTATEVLARTQEKGILLAPVADRLQAEYLGVMIERELGILERQGMLPEPPQALIDAGGEYKIVYDSPIVRAQRSEDANGILETLQMVERMAPFKPDILDRVDLDESIKIYSEVRGAPNKILRSDSEVEEMRAQRAQQEQAAIMTQEASQLAGVAKDLAQAQSY